MGVLVVGIGKTLKALPFFQTALETPYCQNLEESSTDVPKCLIGFPRSGTTLLDTILRTNSKISVVEEKNMLSKAKKNTWATI